MSLTKEQRAAHISVGLCNCCTSKGCSATKPRAARPGKRSCKECAMQRKKQIRLRRGKMKFARRCACGEIRRVGYANCAECAKAEAVKREQRVAELREKGICLRCCTRPVCPRPPRKTKRKRASGPRVARFNATTMSECAECRERRITNVRAKKEERARAPKTLQEVIDRSPLRKLRGRCPQPQKQRARTGHPCD